METHCRESGGVVGGLCRGGFRDAPSRGKSPLSSSETALAAMARLGRVRCSSLEWVRSAICQALHG
eukprot:8415671-Alexandrium_andersonii.AAC.1